MVSVTSEPVAVNAPRAMVLDEPVNTPVTPSEVVYFAVFAPLTVMLTVVVFVKNVFLSSEVCALILNTFGCSGLTVP